MPRTVDAHLHFWNVESGDYGWLAGADPSLSRTFAEAEVAPQLEEAGVDAAVLVQAADTTSDTASMLAIGAAWDRVAGVVGWVPLAQPGECRTRLDELGDEPLFCGVRHLVHDEPDADWVLRDEVLESLGELEARGIPFDLVAVLPRHLEHAATLARRFPELVIVLDHLAAPPIASGDLGAWATLLRAAAESPNVVAKISGLTTLAGDASLSSAGIQPAIDIAIDAFGPARLIAGSDWPVSTLAGRYADVWDIARQSLGALTPDERLLVLGGTAERVYSLQ